jgi:L-ribulose-5-phosphate 3-epimerase
MKKGINIWSFSGETDISVCMKTAKDAGFDGIELALNESGPLSLESTIDEVRAYRKLADEIGIQLTSLASGLYWNYPLTSSRADIRKKAQSIVKKQ